MKTSTDPRHVHRRKMVQNLFTVNFDPTQADSEIKELFTKIDSIDESIREAAPEWPISKINHVDLAILRLATYELIVVKKEPIKVVIDEAVELAKEFGGENSPAFVNGALGAIAKKIEPKEENIDTNNLIEEQSEK